MIFFLMPKRKKKKTRNEGKKTHLETLRTKPSKLAAAGLILLVFGFVEDRGDRRINEREKEKGDGDGEEDCPNRGECSGAGSIV